MIILGVDPGSRRTGYGVIACRGNSFSRIDSGTIMLESFKTLPERLHALHQRLDELIREHTPDAFSLETAFYNKNVQSTLKLGHVRGVAMLCAAQHGLDIYEYSPREVKRAVTGNGGAAKQQIEYMVKNLLAFEGEFAHDDEADGIALALCHALQGSLPKKSGGDWNSFLAKHPDRIVR
ncbi:MAG: crossover junction endodeoxyribonuclease RuvC [Ectothiorhodospiraceae bacterium]|nr:crossover junction endodeoxyribonuclease RuvC [Ectothiorhodospiraceae bacterium]